MANVGNHSIVGAGSVVTNDLPDYSIATGNPARVIKSRDNSYIS
jgi:acetyltransferase-like isoleucine patch superfamily enzyme